MTSEAKARADAHAQAVFKSDMMNVAFITMIWLISFVAWRILVRFGLYQESVFAILHTTITSAAIAGSKPRRTRVVELVRVARTRLANVREERAARRPRVLRAPASRLDRLARLFWSSKTYDRVFAPARADIIHEWHEAERVGDRQRANVIRYLRGPLSMLSHMVAQVPVSIAKLLVKLWTTVA